MKAEGIQTPYSFGDLASALVCIGCDHDFREHGSANPFSICWVDQCMCSVYMPRGDVRAALDAMESAR